MYKKQRQRSVPFAALDPINKELVSLKNLGVISRLLWMGITNFLCEEK